MGVSRLTRCVDQATLPRRRTDPSCWL